MKEGIYWRGKRYRLIKRPAVKKLMCKAGGGHGTRTGMWALWDAGAGEGSRVGAGGSVHTED